MQLLSFLCSIPGSSWGVTFFSSFIFETAPDSNNNFMIPLFSDLLSVAIIILNISLLYGGIVYLLEFDGRNGKIMVIRSVVVFLLLISLFSPAYDPVTFNFRYLDNIFPLISYILAYLLFIFAASALILFIGNLGFYLLSSHPRKGEGLKRCGFCLLCVLLPLGFQFPKFPL